MNILSINYEYPPLGGGGGFVTRDILEHLVKLGHQVTIVTSGHKDLQELEIINGVNVIRVPVLMRSKIEVASLASMLTYVPSSIIKSLAKFNSGSFDIINTHFAVPSGPAGQFLAKMFRIPNVLSIHGGDIFDPSKSLSPHKSWLLRKAVSSILNMADRVVAQSSDTQQNAYRYYNVKRGIDIIPLGIRKPEYTKTSRQQFGLAADDIVFCTIGRLVKRKNLDDALALFSQIHTQKKIKFLIIGDGPELQHLQQLVAEYQIQDSVKFLGTVSNEQKFQILDISDIYVSTAMHEGFGLVFLEAMECGLPVVCYNRGGQNDFLEQEKTGYLVECGDKDSFAERIIELASDAEKRKNMGNYNRELVKDYYIETCAEKYFELFRETIAKSL